jgi:putative ABC transport system substrate-binding protein
MYNGETMTKKTRRGLLITAGVLLLSPISVVAQPTSRTVRIGVLATEPWAPLETFRNSLAKLGYREGQNLVLEYRYSHGHPERFTALAKELVDLKVDVILSSGTPASLAAKRVTTVIPVVMHSGDAVAVGLVSNLSHPGANVTGISTQPEQEVKRLQLIKELMSKTSRIAVLLNESNPNDLAALKNAQTSAQTLGMQVQVFRASDEQSLQAAFDGVRRSRSNALLVLPDPFLLSRRSAIADFALKSRLPSMFTFREHVVAGGLVSYSTDFRDILARLAVITDSILKGAKVGDLPVEQPTKFELVVNSRTAKALGLKIPEAFMARVDEVIE